ncbi:probable protein arginine N-methyltransferase 6.1 [Musa acuminata AAA Group]|uniref:probable protein arginine N-methyltransferase 6.1 n=1 Tax=Musa acuminata AAA Group TaxID=214697 RepID=UPI0031D7FBC3
MMPDENFASSFAARWIEGPGKVSGGGGDGGGFGYWQPRTQHLPQQQQQQEGSPAIPPYTDFDRSYFRAYSDIAIHKEMIQDRVRTETYLAAIMKYRHLIFDKVVLDVGCGTGILAIFCAAAGAKRVYAVDASEIAEQARHVVEDNNLSDRVTVLFGRVEDVSINEKVDIIISEWMGYMLLHENMLPSIIFSRDKWLKPGGLILPSHASLFMAPVTYADRYHERIGFWRDVHGIKMSAMLQLAKHSSHREPHIEIIPRENVVTRPILVKDVDCYTVTIQELESVTTRFCVTSTLRAPLHGFAFWFDAAFGGPAVYPSEQHLQLPLMGPVDKISRVLCHKKQEMGSDEEIMLSTAPGKPPTHWKQTMLYLYDPMTLNKGQKIAGCVTVSQSKENRRFLDIRLEFSVGGRTRVKVAEMR